MKSKLMKILSLAMALTLVASLAACGGSGEEETTTGAADITAEDVVTPENPDAEVPSDETPVEETTIIVTNEDGKTEVVTKAPGKDPTKAPDKPGTPDKPNDPQKPADNGMAAPKNAAEAMKMYNDAIAKTSISGKMTKVNLNKAEASLVGDLKALHPDVEPTFKSETIKKFNNKLFPINNATLKSASKSGNVITINFALAPVAPKTNPAYGENGFAYFVTADEAKDTVTKIIAKIGKVAEDLKIKIKSIDSIGLTGTMQVKIDANTGKLISAEYSFTETVKGKASAVLFPNLTVDIIGSGTCTYTGK